jgi:hypothetical protein
MLRKERVYVTVKKLYIVVRSEVTRNTKIRVGKSQGKRSFERPDRRWKVSIKMDLEELCVCVCGGGGGGVDCIHLAAEGRKQWSTLVNKATHLRVSYMAGECLDRFSRY